MQDHDRKQIFDRLKPGTPHYDLAKGVVTNCLGIADQAAETRRQIRLDPTISETERRKRMSGIGASALARRLDEVLKPVAPIRAHMDAIRGALPPHAQLSKSEDATMENLALVEAAAFFARRELTGP